MSAVVNAVKGGWTDRQVGPSAVIVPPISLSTRLTDVIDAGGLRLEYSDLRVTPKDTLELGTHGPISFVSVEATKVHVRRNFSSCGERRISTPTEEKTS
jgi:hypothetical protein